MNDKRLEGKCQCTEFTVATNWRSSFIFCLLATKPVNKYLLHTSYSRLLESTTAKPIFDLLSKYEGY